MQPPRQTGVWTVADTQNKEGQHGKAQGASDSDDDVELVERTPGRRARGCTVRTCHLRNRSTRAYLTFPIVTFHLHRSEGEEEG